MSKWRSVMIVALLSQRSISTHACNQFSREFGSVFSSSLRASSASCRVPYQLPKIRPRRYAEDFVMPMLSSLTYLVPTLLYLFLPPETSTPQSAPAKHGDRLRVLQSSRQASPFESRNHQQPGRPKVARLRSGCTLCLRHTGKRCP